MYLLPTVSIFYVQVELCHIFRDYDGRWQISDRGETRHKYYGTKSLFVLPWILADEIIFIVIVPNSEIENLECEAHRNRIFSIFLRAVGLKNKCLSLKYFW